jgi:malonyl-CoA O-methyltransferase
MRSMSVEPHARHAPFSTISWMQSPQATQTPSFRSVCGHTWRSSAVGEATPDHGTTARQTVYQRRMTVDHLSTREGYDRWAEVYDTDGNPLIALEEPQVDLLLGDVTGLAVADIGCGTGRHALRLAGRGARVTAVDFSEQMLARAKAKPGADAITFFCHDLTHGLPLDDASFDRVTCGLVVDHIADLAGLFGELGRIVHPGGIVVVSVMHPAMMLKGVQARFTDPTTGRETRPASHPNQISDYVRAAVAVGLTIAHVSEHAVDDTLAARLPRAQKYLGWPMLFLLGLRR